MTDTVFGFSLAVIGVAILAVAILFIIAMTKSGDVVDHDDERHCG